MAKDYELIFKVTELSENDFSFLANSGSDIYGHMINNKVALYHSNYMNVETQLTHRQRMINWLRNNANGLWYVDPADQAVMFGATDFVDTKHTSITFIYFELADDIIAFKIRWNE